MQDWLNQHQQLLWTLFPIFFIAMWLLSSKVLGYMTGWQSLARPFRTTSRCEGEFWTMRTGYMRMIHFGNSLNVGSDASGLYLVPIVLFRFGMPPLLIPWDQVSVRERKFLFFPFTEFLLGREQQVPLRLGPRLGRQVVAAVGERIPIETIG